MSINATVTSGGSIAIGVGFLVGLSGLAAAALAVYYAVRRMRRRRLQRATAPTGIGARRVDPTILPYARDPRLEAHAEEANSNAYQLQKEKATLTDLNEEQRSLHPYIVPPPLDIRERRHPKANVEKSRDDQGSGDAQARRALAPDAEVAALVELRAEAQRAGFSVPALVQSLRSIEHRRAGHEHNGIVGPPAYAGATVDSH